MTTTVTCPSCGAETPSHVVFCTKCGAKLDLNRLAREQLVRTGPTWPGLAARLLRWVAVVVVAAAVGLLLWPVTPAGQRGGRRDAEVMKAKLVALNSALANHLERAVTVSESQANGYLMALARKTAEAEGARRLRLGEVNLRFTEKDIVALIVARWGVVSLTYEVRGVPVREGGRFGFRVEGARFGHLPMPGLARDALSRKVGAVFARLESERRLLDRLSTLTLGEGAVVAGVWKEN